MNRQLADIERRFDEITQQMSDPQIGADISKLRDLGKERARLETVVELYRRHKKAADDLQGARDLLEQRRSRGEGDGEDRDPRARSRGRGAGGGATPRAAPRDPLDDKGVVLEIRAGAGAMRPRCSRGSSSSSTSGTPRRSGGR
ncbi:MAG: PCRF domain-containing protein, partial [Myxococcales bacterium]|nr:PCRF domain-containing protein [Myxococcales bacterium]